jgi:hypothetical protein
MRVKVGNAIDLVERDAVLLRESLQAVRWEIPILALDRFQVVENQDWASGRNPNSKVYTE